jgi:hypothetical protein
MDMHTHTHTDLLHKLMHTSSLHTVYEFFLEQIRDSQSTGPISGSTLISGDVQVAVPVHGGVDAKSLDLAWSAAYPIITSWLLRYYGTSAMAPTVRAHWSPLKRWVAAQLKHANNSSSKLDGLPALWQYGDQESPTGAAHAIGPGLSAASFVIAVEAMATMADAIGESADASTYRTMLTVLRSKYETVFWNSTKSMGYAPLVGGVQTMNAVAIAAGMGDGGRASLAAAALLQDVTHTNANHLAVGHAGAKYLLNTLSGLSTSNNDSAYHDAALRVAMQEGFPSWGYWLAQGGTTCWYFIIYFPPPRCASYTPSIPVPILAPLPYSAHPASTHLVSLIHYPFPLIGRETWDGNSTQQTRNHAWLCGGVGEWMYKRLAGITPSSPGYATVSIAPLISRTVGPSSVNATVQTIRGPVSSMWIRSAGEEGALEEGLPSITDSTRTILQFSCTLPVGVEGEVAVPLLGRPSSHVVLHEAGAGVELWSGAAVGSAGGNAMAGIGAISASPNGQALLIQVGSGSYKFELRETRHQTH